MGKKKIADTRIVQLIYNLAGKPSTVKVTQRAYFDMLAYGVTKEGVCELIQEWIDAGKPVLEDITSAVESHAGKTHYIMKPTIDKQQFFLKVGIEKDQKTGQYMLIISAHI